MDKKSTLTYKIRSSQSISYIFNDQLQKLSFLERGVNQNFFSGGFTNSHHKNSTFVVGQSINIVLHVS